MRAHSAVRLLLATEVVTMMLLGATYLSFSASNWNHTSFTSTATRATVTSVTIYVVGENASSQFDWSRKEIQVPLGATVQLKISNNSTSSHDFAVPALGVTHAVGEDSVVTVSFQANVAGRFEFFCTTPCGADHGSMVGYLTVTA